MMDALEDAESTVKGELRTFARGGSHKKQVRASAERSDATS